MELVILAAGVGSRYGGLKQLDAVGPCGETIMEYSAYDAARAGFERAVLVVRPETEPEFRDTVGARIGAHLAVDYVHQTLDASAHGRHQPAADRRKPWGTGHAVLAARTAISDRFAVINADDFYGAESYLSLAGFLRDPTVSRPTDFALQGFRIGPTLSAAGAVSRGLCRADREGWLQHIVEIPEVRKRDGGGCYTEGEGVERRLAADELVSMNMWGFTPAVFEELAREFAAFLERSAQDPRAEFLLPAAIQRLITDRRVRVRVLPEAGQWCGITYREDRDQVAAHIARLVARGVYPERLRA